MTFKFQDFVGFLTISFGALRGPLYWFRNFYEVFVQYNKLGLRIMDLRVLPKFFIEASLS